MGDHVFLKIKISGEIKSMVPLFPLKGISMPSPKSIDRIFGIPYHKVGIDHYSAIEFANKC